MSLSSALVEAFSDIYTLRCSLIIIQAAALILKCSLLFAFSMRILRERRLPFSWIFLFIVIACSGLEDFSWICSLSRFAFWPAIDYRPILFIIRLTWASNILMYQSLALFLESFTQKVTKISHHQIFFICISSFFFLYPLGLSLWGFNMPSWRPPFEFTVYSFESVYALCLLMPITLIYVWVKLRTTPAQKILKSQLKLVITFQIVPHLIINAWNALPITINTVNEPLSLLSFCISNILLTAALFYSCKRVIGLRFLNIHKHVHESQKFNFTNDFKTILGSLGSSTSTNEVKLLTQRFFKQAFSVSTVSSSLTIRSSNANFHINHKSITPLNNFESKVEHFLRGSGVPILNYLKDHQILIYDEVEYDNFYESNKIRTTILHFLEKLQADIFLPIYEEHNIIGYITIERHARSNKLFNNIERDEMIVFASYLAKVINLLQNRNLNELLKQRKDIIEELYLKHQEINQYKESIRSFLSKNEQDIGIIFYKNRKFVFANQEARKLIGINPNMEPNHPYSKALKYIATQAFIYRTNKTQLVKDPIGRQIVLCGIPYLEHNDIIITVYYPNMYDTIQKQIDAIRDPSDWDYLLYLETTHSGKLINQLIPSNGQIFLNFKIDLLKLALSKKALLLELPEEDLNSTVEILHHVSLRETLYTLDIQAHVPNSDTAIKLFGINPLYGSSTDLPILEKLNKKGTLLIKNIHLLDLDAQNNLAQFIRYGFYTIFKSDKRVQSDVRIICATDRDLTVLIQEERFSQKLFNELRRASLSMPLLLTLPEKEMNELVDGFTQQALATIEFSALLSLSDREKDRIATQRPVSLHALKKRVKHLLIEKSKKNEVFHETQFDPAYNMANPKLIEAARLGKHALKDPQLVSMLWNKFKNQNKIALFLGVNRSSVHRRIKEYNII